jgi:formate hydrogenlyase subunit 3/multisubunit Na+/H+ antiporter MnhD subunit
MHCSILYELLRPLGRRQRINIKMGFSPKCISALAIVISNSIDFSFVFFEQMLVNTIVMLVAKAKKKKWAKAQKCIIWSSG